MIKVLEKAIEKVKLLSPERQEYAAALLEEFAADDELTDEEFKLIQEGLDDLDNGRVAAPEQVRAVFDKYR